MARAPGHFDANLHANASSDRNEFKSKVVELFKGYRSMSILFKLKQNSAFNFSWKSENELKEVNALWFFKNFATQWLKLDPFDKQIYQWRGCVLILFIDEKRMATREPFFVNRPPINFPTGRPLENDPKRHKVHATSFNNQSLVIWTSSTD
jgi:hypothetical protein